jgi:hypothetical protein
VVDVADVAAWFQGALGELSAKLTAQGILETAGAGGIYSNALFTKSKGERMDRYWYGMRNHLCNGRNRLWIECGIEPKYLRREVFLVG